MHARRPRLTPAIADTRRAVRDALAAYLFAGEVHPEAGSAAHPQPVRPTSPANGRERSPANGRERGLLLVALSGGTDSLALAAAVAFEAPRAGIRAGAVVVDHGLQAGSADVAASATLQAEQLGLAPVVVRRVVVGTAGGPEAAARAARYGAFAEVARELGASAVLLGHTLDDQAETVLLGLARGSGTRSIAGMAVRASSPGHGSEVRHSDPQLDDEGAFGVPHAAAVPVLRPMLGITRAATRQACADAGLTPWDDPHNLDPAYARVRVRERVLPVLERELGPGVAEALARTAEQTREDADALDHFAEEQIEDLAEPSEAGLSLPVSALAANPPALRHRLIRLAVQAEFGRSLSRTHTLEVARLIDDWSGQGELHLPGVRVERRGARIHFSAAPSEAQGDEG